MSEHHQPPTVFAVPETEPETEPETRVDLDDEDDQPLRWYVIAAFMTAVVAGFAVAVLLSVLWFATCGDHHRDRRTSPATRHAPCASAATGWPAALVAVGWLAGFALATFALVRWQRRRIGGCCSADCC